MSTFMANKDTVEPSWHVIDAKGKILGRLATEVASILRGKHLPTFTPHADCGDYVVVINAKDVVLSGNKLEQKKYYNHSGFPGGMRVRNAKTMVEKYPVEMVERAIKGMLPNGRLGRDMYTKLFVYAGPEHKHEAQKPTEMKIK